MLAQLESGACSTWVYWAWFYLTLVVVVLVEGRSLTSGQRLSIGFPSGKKPPRTALSDHNQTKQQAHKQPTHTWEEGEGGKFWKEMFSFDALDWAGIWPKAVAGGCKPVYQMKWEINTVLNVLIGFEFWAFCSVHGKVFQKVKWGHGDELRSHKAGIVRIIWTGLAPSFLPRSSWQWPSPGFITGYQFSRKGVPRPNDHSILVLNCWTRGRKSLNNST